MRQAGFACLALLVGLSACEQPSPAINEDQASCAVYRSFYEQLPAKERHVFFASSSPEIVAMEGVLALAPTRFERDNGLSTLLERGKRLQEEFADPSSLFDPVYANGLPALSERAEPPREEFAADTSGYFDQVYTNAAVRISDCFPEGGPRFVEDSSENRWEVVRKALRGPGADMVWRFSPVAISSDRRRALMIGDFSCDDGGPCGGGDYYLFEKAGSGWTLAGRKKIWGF